MMQDQPQSKTDLYKLTNTLGAFALRLTDLQARAIQAASGLALSAGAALVAIGHGQEKPSIGTVAEICEVTHSVMVRIIDSLVSQGLVERIVGVDRRAVLLELTEAGKAKRDAILQARQNVLQPLTTLLQADEQQALERIAACLLEHLTHSRLEAERICRFCDEGACGADCPVEEKACAIEQDC